MTDKNITLNGGIVGGDWFSLMYRGHTHKLEYFLTFDPDLYYIYKSSGHQRKVSYEEFLDFKYCGYIFFKKEIYNDEHIDRYIQWYKKNIGGLVFINKPLPPIEVMDKIKIKK